MKYQIVVTFDVESPEDAARMLSHLDSTIEDGNEHVEDFIGYPIDITLSQPQKVG